MAVDYKKDVLPLEQAGMTDAQIAVHLSSRTQRPIPCDAAKIVLEEAGLVIEDPITLQRSGSLITHYNGMANGQLKTLLGWFIAHVFGRGTQLSSDTHPRAVQLAAVLSDLPPAIQAVGDEILALGGGQPQAGTTEQDVIDARAANVAQEARLVAYQAINTKAGAARAAAQAAMEAGQTPAEITAAAETAWTNG